ncbi:endonuclease [Aureimonas fodinaquatilis]|uniref:Endonuclease n=1 Tax=Aureimonas fodinaquatilis TaxID=2565783 RepID=A0A5B0DQI2_9HYPH|nr:endonuclease/exonuclease/phosphatase family protein [Aureimonas fodinaquatilis]KAA0969044.1 endonuclease [Aureimonas fodinaquatilis]
MILPVVTETVSALLVPSAQTRQDIAALPRTITAHDRFMAGLSCMTQVETGGLTPTTVLQFPFSLATWNVERCLFPTQAAAKLAQTGADIVLLSEMDCGMARTAQRHTTAEVADGLGMAYAFGVEFLELGLGSDTEREFCADAQNYAGFHGNALVSSAGMQHVFMVRLPGKRFWFMQGDDQPRLGERMAVGAMLETAQGPLVVVSTHLESNSDAKGRNAQLDHLVDVLDARFPGLPIVIGGDLNSGNHIGGDWRDESFFAEMAQRGFEAHGGPIDQVTTRPSLITRWPERLMKLDWFLVRGVQVGGSRIVPATGVDGGPLSDHDLVVLELQGLE